MCIRKKEVSAVLEHAHATNHGQQWTAERTDNNNGIPWSGFSSTVFRSNWNSEMLIFCGVRKLLESKKKTVEAESTTMTNKCEPYRHNKVNSLSDLKPGHTGERQVLPDSSPGLYASPSDSGRPSRRALREMSHLIQHQGRMETRLECSHNWAFPFS